VQFQWGRIPLIVLPNYFPCRGRCGTTKDREILQRFDMRHIPQAMMIVSTWHAKQTEPRLVVVLYYKTR